MLPLPAEESVCVVVTAVLPCSCFFHCGRNGVVCAGDPHLPHTCWKMQEGWLQPPLL